MQNFVRNTISLFTIMLDVMHAVMHEDTAWTSTSGKCRTAIRERNVDYGKVFQYVSVTKWDVWKLYDGAHWRNDELSRNAIQNVWRRSWIHKWRTFPFEKRKSLYQRVSWNNLFTARKWKCKVQEEGHSTNSWLKIGQSFQWQPKAERVDFWT